MFQRLEDGDLQPALAQEYTKMVSEELLLIQPSSLVHLIDTIEPQNDADIRTVLRIKSAFLHMLDSEKPTINLHLTGSNAQVYYTDNRLIYVMEREDPFVTNKKNECASFLSSVLNPFKTKRRTTNTTKFPFCFFHVFFFSAIFFCYYLSLMF